MKMRNGNICCTNLDSLTEKIGDIIVPTRNKSYKRLQVVQACEDEVEKGKIIYVPINSGTEVEVEGKSYTIVNVREIILILD